MPCYTPLKGYKDRITNGLTFNKTGTSQKLEVACGQCFGCRVDHALMWSIRITHEAAMHADDHGNSWLTLTYDPEHLPSDLSLRPSDVSKFIRALRKKHKHKIRYFYCGEYGELGRPHYHLCLFNHTFNDVQLFKDDEGLYTYTSPTLEKLWRHGFSTVQPLSYRNAAYTAGYVFEKITGQKARDHYLRCDDYGVAFWIRPEYIRMSTGNTKNKHQGLGAGFYEKFKTDFFPSDQCPVPGKGVMQQVPRYYQNILQSEDPGTLELVKDARDTYFNKHKGDFTPKRLKDKYICARANHNLKRELL